MVNRFRTSAINLEEVDSKMEKIIDIVIPVYNEEESIPVLASDIHAAMDNCGENLSWRCIWVDDGSTDATMKQIRILCEKSPQNHSFVHLNGNFGQSAALITGFSHCRQNALIATLDGDAQNDPSDIPSMIKILEEKKVDMVTGIRVKRHDNFKRIVSSKIANGFRNLLTGFQVTDSGCSIRVMKPVCIKKLIPFKGMHRFLSTLILMNGFSMIEVPVKHRERKLGKSKYGIGNRLWVGLADTFAVIWMKHRLVFAEVKERSDNGFFSE
ncbi:MAG: glycosyltransferase family 2 protein [Fibrobacter sp.]|nr:glycosyltransferase family 2 protein [Fibrobacter sp.]